VFTTFSLLLFYRAQRLQTVLFSLVCHEKERTFVCVVHEAVEEKARNATSRGRSFSGVKELNDRQNAAESSLGLFSHDVKGCIYIGFYIVFLLSA
jgi:hypothetical protein